MYIYTHTYMVMYTHTNTHTHRSAERLWARALAVLREKWKRTERMRDRGLKDESALTALENDLKQVTCWCLEGMAWQRCKRRGDAAGAVKLLEAAKTMAPNKEGAWRIGAALAAVESLQAVPAYPGASAADVQEQRGTDKQEDALRRLEEPTFTGAEEDGDGGMRDTEMSSFVVAGSAYRDQDASGDSGVGGLGVDGVGERLGGAAGKELEEKEAKERASSPLVEVNNLAFFAGKLRRRVSHVLDRIVSPRARDHDALSTGRGGGQEDTKGLIGRLVKIARDVTGTRIIDTPPPPPRDPSPVLQPYGKWDNVLMGRASPGLDLEDSDAPLSTVFDAMPSVPEAELGRSEPLPPPGDFQTIIGQDGLPHGDSQDSAYHPGFLRSSEVYHLRPSEPDPLYINGELYSNSMDRLSSKVDWDSEHQRRQARREMRRTPRELRKPDPAGPGVALPPPPADVCVDATHTQFIFPQRENAYEERARLRERERERIRQGRAATPVLRVASPEIGRVAQNLLLTSKGLKVCVESKPGGKVIAAGLMVVIGRDFVIKYQASCMSPFKFLRGLGLNATAEAVSKRIVLLKTRKPVFAHLGITVTPSASNLPLLALDSSEMPPDTSATTAGYVAPALDHALYQGTHGWEILQRLAGDGAVDGKGDAAADAATPPPTREMPSSPPPAVDNIRAVHAELQWVKWTRFPGIDGAREEVAHSAPLRYNAEFENPGEVDIEEAESALSVTTAVALHQLQETTLDRELASNSRVHLLKEVNLHFRLSCLGPLYTLFPNIFPWLQLEQDTNLTERVSSPSLSVGHDQGLAGANAADVIGSNRAGLQAAMGKEGGDAAAADAAAQDARGHLEAMQNSSRTDTDGRVMGGEVADAAPSGSGDVIARQGSAAGGVPGARPKELGKKRVKEKVGRLDTVSVGCQYYIR